MFISYQVLWFVAMIVLLVIEASILNLVTLWFAIGAGVAFLFALFGFSFFIQSIVFVVVSGVLLIFLRKFVKGFLTPRKLKNNFERLTGEEAEVVEAIDNLKASGQVQIRGQFWSARSIDEQPIQKGEIVKIVKVEGVKLLVKNIK